MVGGKTNDDIFATNVCSKEKEKASKKANIPVLPSSTSRAAFRVGGGGLGKHNTHKTHTQEERLERRRGDDIEEEVYTPE